MSLREEARGAFERQESAKALELAFTRQQRALELGMHCEYEAGRLAAAILGESVRLEAGSAKVMFHSEQSTLPDMAAVQFSIDGLTFYAVVAEVDEPGTLWVSHGPYAPLFTRDNGPAAVKDFNHNTRRVTSLVQLGAIMAECQL